MGKNQQRRGSRKAARIAQRRAAGVALAVARNIRIAPLKVRRVVDLIRGKDYVEAVNILHFTRVLAAVPVRKALESAAANAADPNQLGLDPERLYVKTAVVDEGGSFKRMHPTTMGRARVITRRSSHITVEVAERPRATRKGS